MLRALCCLGQEIHTVTALRHGDEISSPVLVTAPAATDSAKCLDIL
jgi:hypothetical protein